MAVTTYPQPIPVEFGKQSIASRQPDHSPRVSTLSFMLGKSNSPSPSSSASQSTSQHSMPSGTATTPSVSGPKFSLGEGKRLLANCLTFACPKPEKTSSRFHRPLHATPPPKSSFLTVDEDDDDEDDDEDDRDYLHDEEEDDENDESDDDDDALFNETYDRHDEIFNSD